MAYQFENNETANFKVQPQGKSSYLTIRGINSNETSAEVICEGIASLLAIGQISGVYENASRVVTENVYDDGN